MAALASAAYSTSPLPSKKQPAASTRDAEIAAPHSAATEALQTSRLLDGPGHANNNLP